MPRCLPLISWICLSAIGLTVPSTTFAQAGSAVRLRPAISPTSLSGAFDPAPAPPRNRPPLASPQDQAGPAPPLNRSQGMIQQAVPQPAEDQVSLALEDLIQIASACNPTLVQARMAIRAAQGRYVQAGLYPNPTLLYVGDEYGNDGSEGINGAAFGQEIVTKGKLRIARAAASWEVQQALWGREAQEYRVLNDVRLGYYEVLVAQKKIEVNQQLVHIGEEGARVTNQLLAAKAVGQPDALQARIEADTAHLRLHEAEQQFRGAWQRLAAVLGRPDLVNCPLDGQIELDDMKLDLDECVAQILTQSPELAQAQAGVQQARNEWALQSALRCPNFEVATAVKYDTGSMYTVADFGLAIPLPIFDRNQGSILEAQAKVRSARNEVRRIELDLYNRIATAFEQYASARKRVEIFVQSVLPNARKSLELTSAGYREGEYDYLTLLTAQRTFFNANLENLDSLQELWQRRIELEGLLLVGGLEWEE